MRRRVREREADHHLRVEGLLPPPREAVPHRERHPVDPGVELVRPEPPDPSVGVRTALRDRCPAVAVRGARAPPPRPPPDARSRRRARGSSPCCGRAVPRSAGRRSPRRVRVVVPGRAGRARPRPGGRTAAGSAAARCRGARCRRSRPPPPASSRSRRSSSPRISGRSRPAARIRNTRPNFASYAAFPASSRAARSASSDWLDACSARENDADAPVPGRPLTDPRVVGQRLVDLGRAQRRRRLRRHRQQRVDRRERRLRRPRRRPSAARAGRP